jgi:phytoene desaturase
MERKSCDVAIMGAGIAGLCAAARLSHAGYKTIILEKMPVLGGRYAFQDYKGFHIPNGAVTFYYGYRDPVLLTLKDVGGKTDFEMKAIPMPRWRFGGKDHDVPPKGVLWHLISLGSRNMQEEQKVINALRRLFRWREPSDSISFSEWLLRVTDNKTIWNILQAWCAQIVGPNLYEVPAGEMIRHFLNFAGTEQLVPKDGLNPVIEALAKVITNNKGEILTSVSARRILVHDDMVGGVEAKGRDGEFEITAKAVISNVGPRKTVELAGEQNFDRGYLSDVKELQPLEGFFFFLSSNGPLYDCPGGLYTIETRRADVWVDYSLTAPDWAPKGKNLTAVYQVPAHQTLYDPRKEYQLFLADLAETFPRFREQGTEVLLVRRYSSGWPCVRSFPASASHQKTPIENLYNVGDAVNPPGWLGGSGAAESARLVAQDITMKVKPSVV